MTLKGITGLMQAAVTRTGDISKLPDKRVTINVGGDKHQTMLSTLRNVPNTRLALLAALRESDSSYDSETGEYWFDRNPRAFGVIMHYMRTEELHVDHSLCGNVLKGEFAFWGIEEQEIEACCWSEYSKFTEHRDALRDLDENFTNYMDEDDGTKKSTWRRFRDATWKFLEDPTSSRGAKVYAVVSMFFVVLSITIFVLETHKLFQVDEKTGIAMNVLVPGSDDLVPTGGSTAVKCCCDDRFPNATETTAYSPTTHPILKILDYICASFFLLEVIFRFGFAPHKLQFFKDALNVIDVICLIPHFTAIILVAASYVYTAALPIKPFMVLRVVRILRIFKLMKHYSAFKILVYTIKVSTKELLLMIVFLMTGVLMFASIIHYTEKHNFPNIPIAIWWALVTMTTVGYGDKYPVDYGGYIVGCACVISGVLVIAFTVPIVVNNFSLYYSHAQTRIKLPQKKRRRSAKVVPMPSYVGKKRQNISEETTSTESNRSPISTISGSISQSESTIQNNLNISPGETRPPDKAKRKAEINSRQEERSKPREEMQRAVTPVEDISIMLKEQTDQLLKEMRSADQKRENERKRQEFKLKVKRQERLKSKVATKWKGHRKRSIDGKMSDDITFVNNEEEEEKL